MIHLKENVDLTPFNTLRLKSTAAHYVVLNDIKQLDAIPSLINQFSDFFVLGGGSNLLLPSHYNGLVIHNQLQGIRIQESGHERIVTAMAGENWDDFVAYCCDNHAFGLENLSLIPGTVGASPIQNIGAYGVEVKDFIQQVLVYDIKTRALVTLDNEACTFSYRNSWLKNNNRFIVISVTFKLSSIPNLNLSYGDIAERLASMASPSPKDLRDTIIEIRQSKLPDPKVLGNVGSFFHNPILPKTKVLALLEKFPNLPVFPTTDPESLKLSAGWLIDNLGLKGLRRGNIGVYPKQALVLVNYGDAVQEELLHFADWIKSQIKESYDVNLNIEPIVLMGLA